MSLRRVDLPVDLNGTDDSGLPWGLLSRACAPDDVHVGAWIVVGSARTQAVARVVDIDGDVVHVRPLRGPVSDHSARLLRAAGDDSEGRPLGRPSMP